MYPIKVTIVARILILGVTVELTACNRAPILCFFSSSLLIPTQKREENKTYNNIIVIPLTLFFLQIFFTCFLFSIFFHVTLFNFFILFFHVTLWSFIFDSPDIFLANESSHEYILISLMLFRISLIRATRLSVTFTVSTLMLL